MAKETAAQQQTVDRVMHEFKHGELETSAGRKVRNPKQAIAIALSEAGASDRQTPAENRTDRKRTKAKEAAGRTAMQQREGRGAKTRTELYAEARRRGIAGRSKMNRAQLQQALSR